jgi:hypothetical protein
MTPSSRLSLIAATTLALALCACSDERSYANPSVANVSAGPTAQSNSESASTASIDRPKTAIAHKDDADIHYAP